MLAALAVVERFLVAAVGERIAILNGNNGNEFLGSFDFGRSDFAEADVANFSRLLHAAECAERFFERRARVDAVQLVKIDAFQLEAAKTHFHTLNEVTGAAYVFGFGGPLAGDAALGGDDDAMRVRRERFADEPFGDLGAVSVGGVNKVDAELDGAAQYTARLAFVGGLAPRAFADQAHGSDSRDGEPANRRR